MLGAGYFWRGGREVAATIPVKSGRLTASVAMRVLVSPASVGLIRCVSGVIGVRVRVIAYRVLLRRGVVVPAQ